MSLLHFPTRRDMLLGSGALFAWAYAPKLARAEGRDPRVLVIVLRGALDGLAMVAPVGDPDWVGLRGDRALVLDGRTPALPLDSLFALNPAMPNLHRLYKAQQAAIVHATATPYRERSHFDGQDVLESGLSKPGATDSGWLNRALSLLEADGRVNPQGSRAFAVGPVTPLVVRGTAPIMSWVPPQLLPASDDTHMRLLDLYRLTDPKLARALEGRRDLVALARDGAMDAMTPRDGETPATGIARVREYFANAAGTAAKYLARPDGPRVGAVGFVGWDTHINEGAAGGQLAGLLGALDEAIGAIEKSHGRRMDRDGGRGCHRVRSNRSYQWHRRHRSRHRHGRRAGGRRSEGRACHRRLARPQARRSARGPRSQAHDRLARSLEGRAEGPFAGRRTSARGQRLPGNGRCETDDGIVRVSS